MINRDTTNTARTNRGLRDTEYTPPNNPTTRRRTATDTNININDELIMSLSDAYENMRARQVTEWETMRRRTFRQKV